MCSDEKRLYDSLDEVGKARYLGFGNRGRPNFDVPAYNQSKDEKILSKGNAFITLGLDRNAGPESGFGGQNATHCGAIDLVAGRKAWVAHSKETAPNGRCRPVTVNNDFSLDAARVYITQRSDVDGYFRLTKGRAWRRAQVKGEGYTSWESPRSAVALKADVIRVMARENIKLVTRTNLFNSQGGALSTGMQTQYGIDLLAMMDHANLQPMVRGENLRVLLDVMCKTISEIISTFSTYVSETRKLHTALIKHTHLSPFYGSPTSPDFQGVLPDGINVLINNITNVDVGSMTMQQKWNQIVMEFLSQTGVETLDADQRPKNILSPYNRNN